MTNDFLIIDSIKFIFPDNLYTILQQCEILNIRVPRFCYHEKLSIAGNCRICLVEISNSFKLIVACATTITKNVTISTINNSVKNARENILEMLLINHPLDCPICDQGGECDLQDQVLLYGKDRSRFKEIKRSVFDKNLSPFIKTIMTRCIHCTRCIRYFNEIVGYPYIGALGRGSQMEISNYIHTSDLTELSGNVIDLCPVGALTSKPFSFTARPWELTNIETLDLLDSFCSKIRVSIKSEKIMRILPSSNASFRNEIWITNKIRFSYDSLTVQRIYTPKIKNLNTNLFIEVSWKKVFKYIKYNLYKFVNSENFMNHFYSYTGNFIDLESLIVFKHFSRLLQIDNINNHLVLENDLPQSYLLDTTSVVDVWDSKVFILYGINTKLENSIYNLKLRKLQLSNSTIIYYIGNKIDLNYEFIHIGLSFSYLLELYYGSLEACYDIFNSSNSFFISGKGGYNDDFNTLLLVKKLDSNLGTTVEFLYNNLFSGELAALDINAKSKIYCNIEDKELELPKFIYFFGFDDYNFLQLNYSNLFIIYHNHHFNNISNKAVVLLPSPVFLEKTSFFMDCYGYVHSSNAVTNGANLYDDKYILFGLLRYVYADIKFLYDPFNTLDFKNLCNSYYFNLRITYNRLFNYIDCEIYKNTSNIILVNQYFRKEMFEESLFFYTTRNFYNMDSISNNSVMLSKNLEKIKILSNF
jgi:NADH dehydrogenase (ubiquinone) Fe-S protein 1